MGEHTLRRAESDDIERVRELAESSMTTSYALSPNDIEQIVEEEFGKEEQQRRLDSDEYATFVAESGEDGVISGVVIVDDDDTIRRLHVDPERRGAGIGTQLFERAAEELDDRGESDARAVAMAANNTAGAFFERFDLEQVRERTLEIGSRETVEYVYAEDGGGRTDAESEGTTDVADADDDSGGKVSGEVDTDEFPETVESDGQTVYVGEDVLSGTEGAFVPTYLDDGLNEEYGYYCLNCESTDVSMDSMERLRCGNCGNTHKPDDDYDGSYL